MADPGAAQCKSCKAPILWTTTVNGKAMPVDVEPSERGNIHLASTIEGVGATVLDKKRLEAARASGEVLYLSHHVSCRHGRAWRR